MQKIIKRLLDFILSGIALILLSPIMLIAALGIFLSSKGPIFYKAKRMGKGMKYITIYKFRTMGIGADNNGAITGTNDARIYPWGSILRKTKIDELPQLINILNGTMSIVGPRPEDINIVNSYYTEEEKKTLDVLPGLACPGSIFNYTHGEVYLVDHDTDEAYTSKFLHVKLALDLYYLKHWSLKYDIEIICRTIWAIIMVVFSHKKCQYPREYIAVYGSHNTN